MFLIIHSVNVISLGRCAKHVLSISKSVNALKPSLVL